MNRVNGTGARVTGKRQMPTVAWALIVLGLAWVARVTVFTRPRAPGQFAVVDTSAALQIIIVAMIAGLVVVSGRSLKVWGCIRGTSGRLLFYYYLLCTASAIWSFLPQISFYRGAEFIVMAAGLFVAMSSCRDFLQAERTAVVISIIVTLLSMTVEIRLNRGSLHTNTYTIPALMVFCYCVGEYFGADPRRRRALTLAGAASLPLLMIGTSGASNASAVFGMLVVAVLLRKRWLAAVSGFVMLLGLAVALAVRPDPWAILEILFPGKDEKDILTMSGRVHTWAVLWDYFLQRPVIGGGFAVLSSPSGTPYASTPHNSILAAMVGTGLLGLTVASLFIGKLLRELRRTANAANPGSIGCAAAIAAALLNSLAKPMILAHFEPPSVAFLAFLALFLLWVIPQGKLSRTRPPKRFIRTNLDR